MHTLPCTTVAGRHAADRQRALVRPQPDPALVALDTLAAYLRKRPLNVIASPARGGDMACIALKIRLEYLGLDYVWIDAVLNDLEWTPTRESDSRLNARYDIRVVQHKATGAKALLIITLPYGAVEHVEAA